MNCKPGDTAEIIESIDGINVGKIVEVCTFQGVHSVFGPIWRIRSTAGELITEYGAVGFSCDCADKWLRPIPPVAVKDAIAAPDKVAA
jgi:hypothetical protein